MIWIIAVSILVYLAVGYVITMSMVKSGKIDNAIEFWWVIVFWLPTVASKIFVYLMKGLLYAPKKIADWHIDKLDSPPKKKFSTSSIAPPPKRP